jgi:hypothetical protein
MQLERKKKKFRGFRLRLPPLAEKETRSLLE